eukprot:gene26752-4327_t
MATLQRPLAPAQCSYGARAPLRPSSSSVSRPLPPMRMRRDHLAAPRTHIPSRGGTALLACASVPYHRFHLSQSSPRSPLWHLHHPSHLPSASVPWRTPAVRAPPCQSSTIALPLVSMASSLLPVAPEAVLGLGFQATCDALISCFQIQTGSLGVGLGGLSSVAVTVGLMYYSTLFGAMILSPRQPAPPVLRTKWVFAPLCVMYILLLAISWQPDTLSLIMPGNFEEALAKGPLEPAFMP